MAKPPYSKQEVETVLADRDLPFSEKLIKLDGLMYWFLQEYAEEGKTYRNSDICRAVIHALDLDPACRLPLSYIVSNAGRHDDFKGYVRPGKPYTRKRGGKQIRSIARVWTSDWANDDGAATALAIEKGTWEVNPDPVPTPYGYAQIEQGYDPPPGKTVTISEAEYEDLTKRAMANVVGASLDNENISRHPKPGFKPATCGQCHGSGRVHIKE